MNLQEAQEEYKATKSAIARTTEILQERKDDLKQEMKRRGELKLKKTFVISKGYYYNTAVTYKGLLSRFHIWKEGVLFALPPTLGLALFIIFDMLTDNRTNSFIIAVLIMLFSFLTLWKLSKSSTNPELSHKHAQIRQEQSQVLESLTHTQHKIKEINQTITHELGQSAKLQKRLQELEIIGSPIHLCQRLFNENWLSMRNVEFEQYLERVFKLLGYTTHSTNTIGDQEIDLVVEKSERRAAIQVKGYLNNVNNLAVEEALAGMKHYDCHACAVITNGRFTQTAIDLAANTNCILIYKDNFKEFVFGELTII